MKNTKILCALFVCALPAIAGAQTFSGGLEVGYGTMDYGNSDDGESANVDARYGAAHLDVAFSEWRVTLDANHTGRNTLSDPFDSFDSYAPEDATAYGLHVGRIVGDTYVGGFVGRNRFQGDDASSSNGFVTGSLFGLEAEKALSFGSVFGQLGQANMVGEESDTAFDGVFFRVGATVDAGQFDLVAAYERGTSPSIFEDEDDSGTYSVFEFGVEYPLSNRFVGTLGVEMVEFQANTEDLGSETTIKLGLRVPLGSDARRNNLKTTYMPGLAAAWAETLD